MLKLTFWFAADHRDSGHAMMDVLRRCKPVDDEVAGTAKALAGEVPGSTLRLLSRPACSRMAVQEPFPSSLFSAADIWLLTIRYRPLASGSPSRKGLPRLPASTPMANTRLQMAQDAHRGTSLDVGSLDGSGRHQEEPCKPSSSAQSEFQSTPPPSSSSCRVNELMVDD